MVSKVGSLDNAAHKPGGGTKKVRASYHDNQLITVIRIYKCLILPWWDIRESETPNMMVDYP